MTFIKQILKYIKKYPLNKLDWIFLEWQQRPLDSLYPFVWLNAIHYKIKEDARYVSKAIYTIWG